MWGRREETGAVRSDCSAARRTMGHRVASGRARVTEASLGVNECRNRGWIQCDLSTQHRASEHRLLLPVDGDLHGEVGYVRALQKGID